MALSEGRVPRGDVEYDATAAPAAVGLGVYIVNEMLLLKEKWSKS